MDEIIEQIEVLKDKIADKKSAIGDVQHNINSFDVSEYLDEDEYISHLNDVYGEVVICGFTFDAGTALKELDPTAVRVGFSDWCNDYYVESIPQYTELESELEDLESELSDLGSELEDLESKLEEQDD